MILSGLQIQNQIDQKRIIIDPFNPDRLGPNSYDLTLGPTILEYKDAILDSRLDNPTTLTHITKYGLLLRPGRIYLASTVEYTETHSPYVPFIEGRSSIGRLGLSTHATAGFGDCGFCGNWTLELSVIQPVRIYAGMRICQIAYYEVTRPVVPYKGKYQNNREPTKSKLYLDKE